MPVKPSPVINSSPLIALVAALPEFDALAGIVGRLIVPTKALTAESTKTTSQHESSRSMMRCEQVDGPISTL
jgi:hypothetical protein